MLCGGNWVYLEGVKQCRRGKKKKLSSSQMVGCVYLLFVSLVVDREVVMKDSLLWFQTWLLCTLFSVFCLFFFFNCRFRMMKYLIADKDTTVQLWKLNTKQSHLITCYMSLSVENCSFQPKGICIQSDHIILHKILDLGFQKWSRELKLSINFLDNLLWRCQLF